MISYMLVYHPKPVFLYVDLPSQTCTTNNKWVISTFKFLLSSFDLEGGVQGQIWPHQNIPSQDFLMRNIPCEFEISSYNTLCSRGPPKVFAESRKTPMAAILFFQMRPKIFPGNILWLWIYSANLRRLAIIFFFVRAVTVKSLYTLLRRRNEKKSIASTG